MELSANDVRTFEFPTQLRGYDKHAVDTFKEQVAARIEQLKQELLKATVELESQKTQLNGLKQFEDAIKNAAIDARKNADATIANAKREAEQLLSQAQAEATQLMGTRSQQREELEAQITKLELTKKSYLTKFRSLVVSHLEWIEELAHNDAAARPGAGDSGKLEITATAELMEARRETIASRPTRQGIVTEDANAASPIVQVASQTGRVPVQPTPAPADQAPPQPLDPELAAALESYRKLAETRSHHEPLTSAPSTPKPPTRDAFVPAPSETEHHQSTDRMKTAEPSFQQVLESHLPNLDIEVSPNASQPIPAPPPAPTPAPTSQSGGDISEMLDRVARAFEDEMDKAAKN